MNNIFLPNDPLLYNQSNDYQQLYEQKLLRDRELLDKQYKDYISKLQPTYVDKLNQLNTSIRSLSPELKTQLENNQEFIQLNKELQDNVQMELIELVKQNINSNPSMVSNIDKQISIIIDLDNKNKEVERQNISEINDYLKNYSNMTFDEYKKLKNVGNEKR